MTLCPQLTAIGQIGLQLDTLGKHRDRTSTFHNRRQRIENKLRAQRSFLLLVCTPCLRWLEQLKQLFCRGTFHR